MGRDGAFVSVTRADAAAPRRVARRRQPLSGLPVGPTTGNSGPPVPVPRGLGGFDFARVPIAAPEEAGVKSTVPRFGDGSFPPGILAGGRVDPRVESAIDAARGGGRTLERSVRERLELGLGHSLEDVRVHSDARSGALARAVSARAFAVGSDVFFAPGAYRPGSPAGDALIAHEATHVVQQRGAPVDGALTVSSPGDVLEREAEATANAMQDGVYVPSALVPPRRTPARAQTQRRSTRMGRSGPVDSVLQRQPTQSNPLPATKDPGVPGLGKKGKQVQYLVNAGFRDLALDYVVREKVTQGVIDPGFLKGGAMYYDDNLTEHGICSMQSWDYTAGKAEPTKVRIGPGAFSSVPYLYSVVMHEYQHVLQAQSLANQQLEAQLRPQGLESGNEVEAYAWELLHTDETGLKALPEKVAKIWGLLNEAFWKLDSIEQKKERALAKRAEQRAKALVGGTGVTLDPFEP